LRGLNKEVLREYQVTGDGSSVGNWRWNKDYIYAGSKLLASESPTGIRHYHLDHLGTPRVITDSNGNPLSGSPYQYFPFGEAATVTPPTDERLRFTGHERDHDYSGLSLDYMHARFYNSQGGKFLSVDPGNDVDPKRPQSWNLYSYVRNNPVNITDPTGRNSLDMVVAASAAANKPQINTSAATFSMPDMSDLNSIPHWAALTGALGEAVSRIDSIASCANLFGGKNNALNLLSATKYSLIPYQRPTVDQSGSAVNVVGAGTLSPHKVLINTYGIFLNDRITARDSYGHVVSFNAEGLWGLRGIQQRALILLHELGHQSKKFGSDAGDAAKNHLYTNMVLKACFPER
jgi:RHS repeat-associated protein